MSDTPVAVRDTDLVPVAALREWLAEALPALVPAGTTVSLQQFPAGFSNLTYLVTLHGVEEDRALVLRRAPRGVTGGVAHDMVREYGILTALHPHGVPVPRPVVCCGDSAVIGAPFYLMEYVHGVILRGAPPAILRGGDAEHLRARMHTVSRTFVDTLVQLHQVDVTTPSLSELGKGDGYVARQVSGWTKRWHASRTTVVPALDEVAVWLAANQPPQRDAVLVHNDFKLDNLVFDETLSNVRALLDWEMATVGDPLMDLGTSLAYWVEAGDAPIFRALGLGISALPGAWTRREIVTAYGHASGRDVSDASFYLTFGLFKVAVIAQQIYARYEQGLTNDPRFAKLGEVVGALADKAIHEARS